MKVTCPKCESEDVQRLSQQAAPPLQRSESERLSLGGIVVFTFGAFWLVGGVAPGVPHRDRAAWLVVGGLMLVAGILLYRVGRASERLSKEYNHTTYRRLKAEWERTWVCLRCGNRFEASVWAE